MEKLNRSFPATFLLFLALPPLFFAIIYTLIVRPIQKGATFTLLPFWALVDDVTLNRLSFNWQLKSESSQQAEDLTYAQLFAWQALKKNPLRAQNYIRVTEALGRLDEKFLQTAVNLDPHNAHYRLYLAQEQVALGKIELAQNNVDSALASDASTVFTYFLSQKMPLPSLHASLISGLKKLITQNPENSDVYGYLADWYRYNNYLDLAIDVAQRGYTKTNAAYLLKIKERCEYLKEKGLNGP